MEEKIYFLAFIISIIYFFIKFIEMRYISKVNLSLKELFTNTIIVYLSVIAGYFVLNQFKLNISSLNEPPVFIDGPGF